MVSSDSEEDRNRAEAGPEDRPGNGSALRRGALALLRRAKAMPARLRPRRGRRALDLTAADRLVALSDDLERIMGEAEPRFLELGGRLQSLYADADDLVKETRRAAAAVGEGGETGLLAHLDGMVHDALADLKARREAIAGRLNDLTGSAEQLLRLSGICGGLGKTGLSLNVVGLNIAVESSRSAASGEMFAVFTDEIRGLSRRISQISESIRDAGARNRREQLAAHQKIQGSLASLSRLIVEAESIVGRSLERIHELMDFSREALERSTQGSREISRLVGEVVVAIQFHDISRQKVEHVSAAIADAVSLLREPAEPLPVVRGRVHRLLTLQGGQLREMVDEIYAARRRAAEAFRDLTSVVTGLVADAELLDVGDDSGDRLAHHRRGLEKGLRQLRELLKRGRDMDLEIRRIAEEGADAASGLSDHIDRVRGISFDLHLKALNAVVKSARLRQEGLALEVLAQEVSKLSAQSGGFVDEVVDILESLVSLSLDLDLMEDEEADDAADRNIGDGLAEMSGRFDQFQADAALAPERSRALQTEIQAAGQTLDFLDSLGRDLSERIAELAAIVDRFAPWSRAAWKGSVETLEQAAHRYTMESERRLHSRYFEQATVAALTGESEDGAVELFGEENPAAELTAGQGSKLLPAETGSPEAREDGERMAIPDGDPDEILWPEPEEEDGPVGESEASAEESQKESGDDDLGDNVELF